MWLANESRLIVGGGYIKWSNREREKEWNGKVLVFDIVNNIFCMSCKVLASSICDLCSPVGEWVGKYLTENSFGEEAINELIN